MEIGLTKEIQTIPKLTMITNGTIEVNGEMHPVLELDIEPGEDSEEENLGFTWYAVSMTNTTLTIQLEFANAHFISANSARERMKVLIRDPLLFTSYDGLEIEREHL